MSTAITTTNKRDIKTLLMSPDTQQRLQDVLPKYLTPERMARVALATITRVPKLGGCTPESLLLALMTCAQAGLEPDGRHAHLIPYGDQVQVIFDYKGLVWLAQKNHVHGIRAAAVCENDSFDYRTVDGQVKFSHEVDWKQPRGKAYAYYVTSIIDGELDVEVMQREEVEAIRRRSKAGSGGPWVTDFDEMAKKTVIRRMSKRWPLASEVAAAIMADDDKPARAEVDVTPAGPVPSFDAAPVALPEPAPLKPRGARADYAGMVMGLCQRDGIAAGEAVAALIADGSVPAGTVGADIKPAIWKLVYDNWTEFSAKLPRQTTAQGAGEGIADGGAA